MGIARDRALTQFKGVTHGDICCVVEMGIARDRELIQAYLDVTSIMRPW